MTRSSDSYGAHLAALLRLGLPLVGGHLAQVAIGLTDTVMLGWYGVTELAVLTLATMAFFVLFIMLSGFAWAVMPMVARFQGEGDSVQIRRATRMGLWLSLFSSVLAIPVLWHADPLLRMLGQKPELAALAQVYLRIAGFGLIPALAVMVLKSYLAALEHAQVVLWVTVIAAVVNAFGNYALIFGNWGMPELGLRGAAISSLLSHLAAFLAVAAHVLRRFPEHALFTRFWRPDAEMLAQVFRLGVPIGLTSLAEVVLFAATALFIGFLGELPLAAHGIALQMASATFVVHLGLSNAATVRAGNAYGRRDPEHLKRGARAALGASVAVACVTIVTFLAVPEFLVSLFLSPDEPQRDAIITLGVSLLTMAALFQLVDGAQVTMLGLLRGVQDTNVPMWIAAFSYWVVGLPAVWLLGFWADLGAIGIWGGLVVGLGAAAVLLTLRFWLQVVPGLGVDDTPPEDEPVPATPRM